MSHIESIQADRLLEEARRGCGRSLGHLLQMYRNYLRLLAGTQLDRKLQGRASGSDVVQDTLLEAHRDFEQFRGQRPEEFVAWLRRILIHNLARVVERNVLTEKRDVRREVSIDDLREGVDQSQLRLATMLAADETSPSRRLISKEDQWLLADEIEMLDPPYREVIRLRHVEGLAFEEVARRMRRTSGATRMLWMRALARLRANLAHRGIE